MLAKATVSPDTVRPGLVAEDDFVVDALVALLDDGNIVGEQSAIDSDPRDVERVSSSHLAHTADPVQQGADSAFCDLGAATELGLC